MRYCSRKLLRFLITVTVLVPLCVQLAAQTVAKPNTTNATKISEPPAPLLPPAFDGWIESANPTVSTKPEVADPANAAALTEFGFVRYVQEQYTRTSNNASNSKPETLTVKAIQFPDATGAYGAFTLYRRPNMAAEEIGTEFKGAPKLGHGGAYDDSRVLFWSGTILVDAQFSRTNAMTTAEMRDLANLLPAALSSNSLIPPPLPRYLPTKGLEAMSIRYAVGPAGYQLGGGVLPADLAAFDRSGEAVTANYNVGGGEGSLTLLEYPTPQMAMAQEKVLTGLINSLKAPQNTTQNGAKPGTVPAQGLPEPLTSSAASALQVRRSGPLVAITTGNFTERQAQLLIGSLHYDADITVENPQGYIPEPTKTARLLLNIVVGSSIICFICLVLGLGFGFGRALIRVLQGKSASAMDETMEMIKLNLSTTAETPKDTQV